MFLFGREAELGGGPDLALPGEGGPASVPSAKHSNWVAVATIQLEEPNHTEPFRVVGLGETRSARMPLVKRLPLAGSYGRAELNSVMPSSPRICSPDR